MDPKGRLCYSNLAFLWIVLLSCFLSQGLSQEFFRNKTKQSNSTIKEEMIALDENSSAPLNGSSVLEKRATTNITSDDLFPIPSNGRIPTWIQPINYDLWLDVSLTNASYNGTVAILFEAVNATDKIILNMVDLVTKNESCQVTRQGTENQVIPIKSQEYNPSLQFYIIRLNQTLNPGNLYKIKVDFWGTLNSILVGFYLSTYKDSNGQEIRVASTQFSPTDARRAFPCLDEPAFKATFEVTIQRDSNVSSLSNMPIASTTPVVGKEGRFEDRFHRTLKMSTYLVGFLVSDFEFQQSDFLNETPFRVWSRPEALNQTEYALDVGPKLLLYLEDYFGVKYPLPKMDMAAIPNFKFNGMENWGLIMYRESALLFDPEVSSTIRKRNIIRVVAHEIAHMWFGNLVTPMWWSDLWLKEGFANFMGYMAVDQVEPQWQMMDNLVQTMYSDAFALDSLHSSHPLNVNVDHPDRISEIFDAISYSKGGSIIRMMQHFLTGDVFRRGMEAYITHLQYGNAEQKDLWGFLTGAWQEESSFDPERSVETIMNTWTLQDGFPVVTVIKNGSHLSLSQTRFLLHQRILDSVEVADGTIVRADPSCPTSEVSSNLTEKRWWIPVSYVTKSSPNFNETQPRVWMSPQDKIALVHDSFAENDWIILNVQKTGFYRVNYDNATWYLLLQQLLHDHTAIHHLNRAQLIDDAMLLARAGLLDYDITLKMGLYLRQEEEQTPWTLFLISYEHLLDMVKSTEEDVAPFNAYLLDLILPMYHRTGFVDQPGDSYATHTLRSLATQWACEAKYGPCVAKAQELFQSWMYSLDTTSSANISSNVKSTVLCTGLKNASAQVWNQAFAAYLNSNVQTEKTDILNALGCNEDPEIIERYLEMALDPESGIAKQDCSSVFLSASSSRIGRDLAWKIVKRRWREIVLYMGTGSNSLWRVIEASTKNFNTHELVQELREFKRIQQNHLGSARQTVDKMLEKAQINADWMQCSFPSVLAWMKEYQRTV